MGVCVCVTVCSRVPCPLVSHQDLPAPAPNPLLLSAGVGDGPTLGGLGQTRFAFCHRFLPLCWLQLSLNVPGPSGQPG